MVHFGYCRWTVVAVDSVPIDTALTNVFSRPVILIISTLVALLCTKRFLKQAASLQCRWTVAAVDSLPIDRARIDVYLTPISPNISRPIALLCTDCFFEHAASLQCRWTVAAVDSVPIDRALTNVSLTPISPIQNPWQVRGAMPSALRLVKECMTSSPIM